MIKGNILLNNFVKILYIREYKFYKNYLDINLKFYNFIYICQWCRECSEKNTSKKQIYDIAQNQSFVQFGVGTKPLYYF